MINLLVTVLGFLMVLAGFYLMYLGFSTPPNPIFFFIGLLATVFGLILVIFFGSRVDLSRPAAKPSRKVAPRELKEITKTKEPKKIKPKVKPKKEPMKVKSRRKPVKPPEAKPAVKEAPKPTPTKPKPKVQEDSSPEPKFGPQITSNKIKPVKKADKPTSAQPKITTKDAPKETPPEDKPPKAAPVFKADEKPVAEVDGPKKKPIRPDLEKLKSKKAPIEDEAYVKNRLDRLKANYIQNAKDIENIIDDRLDSFKGTIDRLKTESQEPSIIWSFEASDVQEAMKDTISKAEHRILMMYPWVRNIDVGILKKFMDTESRMIIQEASLDDDTSVELIRLLVENKVGIRTMPHVHTVALVSDDTNGLIISTDPIYESYEVGVIYKDQKSIEEIERMFEDAWNLSKDIDLGIRE